MKNTEKAIGKRYGLTRQRLGQLRNGYRNSRGVFIAPRLVRGLHWGWYDGCIIYTDDGRAEVAKNWGNSRKKRGLRKLKNN